MNYAEIIDRPRPRHRFVARLKMKACDLTAFKRAIEGYPQMWVVGHVSVDENDVVVRIGCSSDELRHRLEHPSRSAPV